MFAEKKLLMKRVLKRIRRNRLKIFATTNPADPRFITLRSTYDDAPNTIQHKNKKYVCDLSVDASPTA
jgi:hypothetical protein